MKRIFIVSIIFSLLIPFFALSKTLSGEVVGIADGDTITVLDANKDQHKIRLYGIDCPEKGQPFGKAAKQHTSRLTFKNNAKISVYDTDRYGRTVGVVFVRGVNVNKSLIQNGLAWQYRKY